MPFHRTPALARQALALLTTLASEGFDFSQSEDVTGRLWRDLAAAAAADRIDDALLAQLTQAHDKGQVAPGIDPGAYLALFAFCSHPATRLEAASTYVALTRAWAAKEYWCTPAQEKQALDDLLARAFSDQKLAA